MSKFIVTHVGDDAETILAHAAEADEVIDIVVDDLMGSDSLKDVTDNDEDRRDAFKMNAALNGLDKPPCVDPDVVIYDRVYRVEELPDAAAAQHVPLLTSLNTIKLAESRGWMTGGHMKKPDLDAIKSTVENGLAYAKEHGEPVAKRAIAVSRDALKTKTGKRIATGAIAGGAVGFALPLLTITTGAVLGAGLLVLYKSLQDREND